MAAASAVARLLRASQSVSAWQQLAGASWQAQRWVSSSGCTRAQQQPQKQPSSSAAASTSTSTTSSSSSSRSAAEPPATSFIVNPSGGAASGAPAPAPLSPTAGGVLAGAGPGGALREYSMRQVSKHATDESCWIVVNGKVYDVTSYLDDHPGGSDTILQNAGVDCTDEFMGVHSQEAKDLLEKFVIGRVKAGAKEQRAPATVTSAAPAVDPAAVKVLLQDPQQRYALPLAAKQQLNPDTFFMRFALPNPNCRLGLPCGKHVFLCADIGGEGVVRAYTPISGDRDAGVLDFLIKVYWAGAHPRFPEGGKMSQHLAAMKEGDTIDVKGPFGKFTYEGHGAFTLNRVSGRARYLSMVAGGSGITPCYAVAREVLQDAGDATRVSLVYANKHEEDIWLKQELDAMAADHPDRFHVWYVLEEPAELSTTTSQPAAAAAVGAAVGAAAAAAGAAPAGMPAAAAAAAAAGATAARAGAAAGLARPWRFSRGWVTPDMLAQHLLPPRPVVLQAQAQAAGVSSSSGDSPAAAPAPQGGADGVSLALMCGPPGMLEHVVVPSLAALGFGPEQMVVF